MRTNGHGDLKQSPTAVEEPSDDLTLVDCGAGALVFRDHTESRPHTGRSVVVSRELVAFYRVQDWEQIRQALIDRGLGTGAIGQLPEVESLAEVNHD